ncbi:hypothetical protein [Bosea lathyri]|uniref:Uncharacterized protein n=1 Tax=Bosea lathyri TaxID=1036778 RepID=A0A1H6C8R5_9HYPH|nr:hypothetical protein [Bosea lathyri]SEG69298.1 hypothetical protein SAMN04488115_109136 [Bosea lathyri]
MDKLAGLMVRLVQMNSEFGQHVFDRAVNAASVEIARVALEHAEGVASRRLWRPEIVIFPLERVQPGGSETSDEDPK